MSQRIIGPTHLRDERRNTDTEVHVEAIADFLSRSLRNFMPPVMSCLVAARTLILLRGGLAVLTEGKDLNGLGFRSLDYPIDVDTGDVDGVRREASDGTGKGSLRHGHGHAPVELTRFPRLRQW